MIDLSLFKGQYFAIFGLGISGLSTAAALQKAGARVALWDDSKSSREKARGQGFNVVDLAQADFAEFDGLILSPGVPLTHPKPHWTVDKANDAKLPILGDVELFLQAVKQTNKAKIIAVTGTNGKSTIVSLIHHILCEAGLDAHLGGNIGTTTVLDLPNVAPDRIYIVELSSYQIDLMPSLQCQGFAPDVAVLINVSADHINRHGTIEHYADVKSQIFSSQTANDLAIVGIDDEFGAKYAAQYGAVSVSALDEKANYYCQVGAIYKQGEKQLNLNTALSLQGVHNAQNAAVALAIGKYFNIAPDILEPAFLNFKGLEHRMEIAAEIKRPNGNILFINDSKATNAEAVKPALQAYDDVYWIAGGQAKQGGLQTLHQSIKKIKKAYLFGASAQSFAQEIDGIAKYEVFLQMSDAINKALTDIRHTDEDGLKVILLSPAAASFDQFKNFEHRGQMFKQIAKELGAKPI